MPLRAAAAAACVCLCPAAIRCFGGGQAVTNYVLSVYEPELAAMQHEVRDEAPGGGAH